MKQSPNAAKPTASNATGDTNPAYAPTTPGDYVAVVTKAVTGHYKGAPNETTYLKVTPTFTLFNEQKTIISRHDITFGSVDEHDVLYRPDGNNEKPALWSNGAFLLDALGFVTDDGLIDLEGFDPDLVLGQVVRIKVSNKDYKKNNGQAATKNVIDGFWKVKESDVEALGLYFDADRTGMVFLSEAAANDYADAAERFKEQGGGVGNEQTPSDVWGED